MPEYLVTNAIIPITFTPPGEIEALPVATATCRHGDHTYDLVPTAALELIDQPVPSTYLVPYTEARNGEVTVVEHGWHVFWGGGCDLNPDYAHLVYNHPGIRHLNMPVLLEIDPNQ